jgi:hypothetical protein
VSFNSTRGSDNPRNLGFAGPPSIRAAAALTGGTEYSCDYASDRLAHLVDLQTDTWKFFLGSSTDYFTWMPQSVAFDFCMHDAAHRYEPVLNDLRQIIPYMKRFGIVCIHDTQQLELGREMSQAVLDAAKEFPVRHVTLPYGCGLSIIRVEESANAPVEVAGRLEDGKLDTIPFSF